MVAWLSDWLRDIIAVILLAVFVELLLPNKAMQRYARLVIGLFILLTIISPILKLMQSDIGPKLDEGMERWSESAMTQAGKMTGLSQIQRDAEAMSEKRSLEAAKLTERTIEDSIRNELIERTDAPVDAVDAVLKWVTLAGRQTPYISQVTVTLHLIDKHSGGWKEGARVEEVQPVAVDVQIESMDQEETLPNQKDSTGNKGFTGESQQEEDKWSRADPSTAAAISGLIVQGWGVGAEQIVVRQPAEQLAAR